MKNECCIKNLIVVQKKINDKIDEYKNTRPYVHKMLGQTHKEAVNRHEGFMSGLMVAETIVRGRIHENRGGTVAGEAIDSLAGLDTSTPSSADAFAYGVHGAIRNDLKSAAWMLRRLCVTMGVHGKVDCNTPLYEQAVDLLVDLEAKGYGRTDYELD